MSYDYSVIGKRIRQARENKGFTQEQLAESLDVSNAYISKIERGKTPITVSGELHVDEDELKRKLAHLAIWKKGSQRAPHKPLLILYALAQLTRSQVALPYAEVRKKLSKLLMEFGPARRSYHPEQPFVRLASDGIWELSEPIDKKNFSDQLLVSLDIHGGFTADVVDLLQRNNTLLQEVAEQMLYDNFPETIHPDILGEVGLDFTVGKKKSRDPYFRERILRAYEYSCAVCGFNVRLGNQLVAIDAAHIQWHQSGGPDVEDNGIALCTLHHKLFDRGVFTITPEQELLVAEGAYGTNGFNEWLMQYHGKRIRMPVNPVYRPKEVYIGWHLKEVFRGPARYKVSNE